MGLETFFTPSEQALFFLYSVLLGGGIGVVYDLFRTLRILVPHTSFFVVLEDILFLFVWAVILIVFSVEVCRGEVRIYYLIGNVLGFGLYLFTIGKVVVKVMRILAKAVYAVLKFLYMILVKPVLWLFRLIHQKSKHLFVLIHLKLKKLTQGIKKHLKVRKQMVYNNHTHKKKSRRRAKDVKRFEKGKAGENKKRITASDRF